MWCDGCGERIRSLERNERHPLVEVYCKPCRDLWLETLEVESEDAWDDAWMALYNAAQREDKFRTEGAI